MVSRRTNNEALRKSLEISKALHPSRRKVDGEKEEAPTKGASLPEHVYSTCMYCMIGEHRNCPGTRSGHYTDKGGVIRIYFEVCECWQEHHPD